MSNDQYRSGGPGFIGDLVRMGGDPEDGLPDDRIKNSGPGSWGDWARMGGDVSEPGEELPMTIVSMADGTVPPDLTPDFFIEFGAGVEAADTLKIEYRILPGGTFATYVTHLLTADDLLNVTADDYGVVASLGFGSYEFRSRIERGLVYSEWSNLVTVNLADATAPVLSLGSGTATGSTTASLSVTTDEANGTLYWVVTLAATVPTKAQIKAGQNSSGVAAAAAGNQTITTTGAKTPSVTGLTAGTTYYAHFMHEDAGTNQSNIISTTSFATTGTVWFTANFNVADSGTVTTAGFDSETDANSRLAIVSNELQFQAITAAQGAYVAKTGVNWTEATVKFKVKFSHIAGVHSGAADVRMLQFFDTGSTVMGWGHVYTNGTGDISNYGVVRGNFTESAGSVNFASPSIVAATWYDVWVYFKVHATLGGISMKIGSWPVSSSGFNDNTGALNIGSVRFGAPTSGWGSGANDCTISYDDFQIFLSDART